MANVLTMFRLLLVPAFIYALASAEDGTSTFAAGVFALAAITDFLDGQVARRTNTVTEFGRVADPLADRLLVASALIILLVEGRLPTVGLMAVLFRDALMMAGYYVLSRKGIRMEVIWVGKLSSTVLMLALFLFIAGLPGALPVFWLGVALSLGSGAIYAWRGVAQLRRPRPASTTYPAALERRHLVKAVVMAGGQGTRLRPLTSNQPKPMVPIVNKPTIQHILELVQRHGINEVVMTLAFLPRLIRNYFGDGSRPWACTSTTRWRRRRRAPPAPSDWPRTCWTTPSWSSAATPSPTSTSPKVIDFHQEREAMVTIALKSVENPLEFGVVIVDEEGRIQRFLEKPGWGQVFSDTVNTGIYVLEPEIFDHIPEGQPYDFSHDLFPQALRACASRSTAWSATATGRTSAAWSSTCRPTATRSTARCELHSPGVRLRGNIWVGQGVSLDSLDDVEGPAVIGENARIDPGARILAHTVLGNNAVLRAGAQVGDSVLGRERATWPPGALVRGAVLWQRGGGARERQHRARARSSATGRSIGGTPWWPTTSRSTRFKNIEPGSAVRSVHRLGDPGHEHPLRAQRRARPRQRRRHPGDGHASRHVVRHAHQQGALRHHQPGHASRLPGLQAGHHQRPQLHRASTCAI